MTRSNKLRNTLVVVTSIAVVAVAADLLANTADSGSKQPNRHVSVVPTKRAAPLKLVVGTVSVQNTGPPAKLELPVRRAVLHAAQLYVDDAILAPLKTGRVDNRYETLFDAGVERAASGPDRAVLTEENTGLAADLCTRPLRRSASTGSVTNSESSHWSRRRSACGSGHRPTPGR